MFTQSASQLQHMFPEPDLACHTIFICLEGKTTASPHRIAPLFALASERPSPTPGGKDKDFSGWFLLDYLSFCLAHTSLLLLLFSA